ncbi:MAG: hypothetical protein ABI142_05925, partial [Bryocella sp.]
KNLCGYVPSVFDLANFCQAGRGGIADAVDDPHPLSDSESVRDSKYPRARSAHASMKTTDIE